MASITAVNLLNHVRRTSGVMRRVWLCVAAMSSGFGIWATHFIAMLAYAPGVPSGYNIFLTVLSLIAAMVITGSGLALAITAYPAARWLGGAIVGGGIAAMHYTGMAAFEIAGRISWDATLVVASVALGAAVAAVALPVGLAARSVKNTVVGGVLLAVAICSHHFTAMAAASIRLDPGITVSETALPTGALAIGVALA
ncbi:MAG TPA: MHYT domain-containing protein, partial [Propylenella sp.]|nr:MHYT domain-containing protein [Propylenella sp.]